MNNNATLTDMESQEIKNIVTNSEKIRLELEGEWILIKNTSSILGKRVTVVNNFRADKRFKLSQDEGIKMFIQKNNYLKRQFKNKGLDRCPRVEIK